jgi:HPt (histidine-containing phosphotransfer) domain-containing protein
LVTIFVTTNESGLQHNMLGAGKEVSALFISQNQRARLEADRPRSQNVNVERIAHEMHTRAGILGAPEIECCS